MGRHLKAFQKHTMTCILDKIGHLKAMFVSWIDDDCPRLGSKGI